MEGTHFLQRILRQMELRPGRRAFRIGGRDYRYGELSAAVAQIQEAIPAGARSSGYAAVVLEDDLPTYASILALWFSGMAFIPVNPLFPEARNRAILEETLPRVMLTSVPGADHARPEGLQELDTSDVLRGKDRLPVLADRPPGRDAYVLFTSGSTGRPKGVRITFRNLDSFVRDFIAYPSYAFTEEDRFLQIYDLSFDASVHCYTVPLACGASVFTVPPRGIKYLEAYRLMQEHALTFAKMPPSTLSYLRDHFSSIRLPALRYCLFGGEAFPASLAGEWEQCVPNALIQNVYGPTEATVNCTIYDWNGPGSLRKHRGGIASIGRGFGTSRLRVIGETGGDAPPGEPGELLVAGDQVSPGYWKRPELDREAFVTMPEEGREIRYYRTGDRVARDEEGDLLFLGRRDDQVQIRGYRVELGEIESAARDLMEGIPVHALVREPEPGRIRILLAVEAEQVPPRLRERLAERLPSYMIPDQIVPLAAFPRLVSGKVDRNGLQKRLPG